MFGLFAKAKQPSSRTTSDALVREFAHVMETKTVSIDSIDHLPASKPIMKIALLEAIRREKDGGWRKWLIDGYKFLATFQNLSEDEVTAVKLLSSGFPPVGSEQEREAIIAFMPVADAYKRLEGRVQAEQAELASELRAVGVE